MAGDLATTLIQGDNSKTVKNQENVCAQRALKKVRVQKGGYT